VSGATVKESAANESAVNEADAIEIAQAPILSVVRGEPDEVELTALLLAIMLARGRSDGADPTQSGGSDRAASWDRPSSGYRPPTSWMSAA
jgi:hypothetical protein